jgi:hypothetical protein
VKKSKQTEWKCCIDSEKGSKDKEEPASVDFHSQTDILSIFFEQQKTYKSFVCEKRYSIHVNDDMSSSFFRHFFDFIFGTSLPLSYLIIFNIIEKIQEQNFSQNYSKSFHSTVFSRVVMDEKHNKLTESKGPKSMFCYSYFPKKFRLFSHYLDLH